MFVIEFLKTWAGLIEKLWGAYPFIGGVITLVAVPAFFILRRSSKRGYVVDLAIVVLAWGIVVSILGATLGAVGFVASAVIGFLRFFGGRYTDQPLFVIGVLIVAIIAFFVWDWRVKKQNRAPRIVIVVVAALLIVAAVVPILNKLTPSEKSAAQQSKASVTGK